MAAIALAVVGFLTDPLRLLASLLLILVVVMAGWTALVNRGAARTVAAGISTVALIVLVVLLVLGSPVRLALLVGLVLISTAAARVALGHDLAPRAWRSPERWTGPPRRLDHEPVVRQREGRQVRPGGRGTASRDHADRPAGRDDLRALAEQAVADGADVLGMAGGDGSQALVADVARRHDVAFVCVPAGTRNHLALDRGLDRVDVAAALEVYGDAVERRVDLALLGDRVFVNNASLGVYATVVQSRSYRDAKLATTAQVLPDRLGPGAARLDLRFPGPDGQPAPAADIVLVSNGAYRLESLNGFGTRERIDAGVLGIVAVTVDSARDVPVLLAAEASGHVDRFRGYRSWTAPELEIDSAEQLIDVGVDGEALRLPPPLRFRSLPGALRVRTPIHAPGVAPAAAAPHGVGLGGVALLRVLSRSPRALSGGARRRRQTRFDRAETNHLMQVATPLLVWCDFSARPTTEQ